MSDYVYNYSNDDWYEITKDDTIDCICSLKSTGTWKEFVGVITLIDAKKIA